MSTRAAAAPSTPIVGDLDAFLRAAIAARAPDPARPVGRWRPRALPALCLRGGLFADRLTPLAETGLAPPRHHTCLGRPGSGQAGGGRFEHRLYLLSCHPYHERV
jgi:hypothetical protein